MQAGVSGLAARFISVSLYISQKAAAIPRWTIIVLTKSGTHKQFSSMTLPDSRVLWPPRLLIALSGFCANHSLSIKFVCISVVYMPRYASSLLLAWSRHSP